MPPSRYKIRKAFWIQKAFLISTYTAAEQIPTGKIPYIFASLTIRRLARSINSPALRQEVSRHEQFIQSQQHKSNKTHIAKKITCVKDIDTYQTLIYISPDF